MVTLKDIALRLGVDTSTVSKVLHGAPIRVSEARREEIIRVAKELNYRPNKAAQGLRQKKSGAIALVLPSITNYLYPEIIGGVEDAAEAADAVLFLLKFSTIHPEDQIISVVSEGRVDGLLFADDMPSPGFHHKLLEMEIPFVCLNRLDRELCRSIALNDEEGFDFQAAYLTSLGHQLIAFVAMTPSNEISEMCESSFRRGIERHGLPRPTHLSCDFSGSEIHELMAQLLTLPERPTAIATASFIVASRIVHELRSIGIRVPEDVSVIGYHDSPTISHSSEAVTTVKMPSRAQGRIGVERLMDVINGIPFKGELVAFPPEFVDRGTCRRLD